MYSTKKYCHFFIEMVLLCFRNGYSCIEVVEIFVKEALSVLMIFSCLRFSLRILQLIRYSSKTAGKNTLTM